MLAAIGSPKARCASSFAEMGVNGCLPALRLLPTLAFPRAIPIAGEPADVNAAITEAHAAMRAADYPKLLFTAQPGAIITPAFAVEFVKG
ncbi:MAG: hypothetical protein ACOY91_11010 [Pseudomonadota bacterium]